jgi:hypothetical protein
MNRSTLAAGIVTAAERMADRIDPPEYGVRIVWDDDYEIEGATGWGEPEDSDYAAETRAKVESGEWVIVGVTAVQRSPHDGDSVTRETDTHASLWGIVTDASDLPRLAELGEVWDLSELSGYLRTVADELISEARS